METTSTAKSLTLGLDTFGDLTNGDDGWLLTQAQTIRNLVDEGILADHVGIDFFGIGEHHTDDVPLSAGDVVLGAIASRTSRIRLGSAVTVISSDDPVRSSSDTRPLTRYRMVVPRSSSAAGPASSRSHCSAMTWATTRSSSRRRPTFSPSCARSNQ